MFEGVLFSHINSSCDHFEESLELVLPWKISQHVIIQCFVMMLAKSMLIQSMICFVTCSFVVDLKLLHFQFTSYPSIIYILSPMLLDSQERPSYAYTTYQYCLLWVWGSKPRNKTFKINNQVLIPLCRKWEELGKKKKEEHSNNLRNSLSLNFFHCQLMN